MHHSARDGSAWQICQAKHGDATQALRGRLLTLKWRSGRARRAAEQTKETITPNGLARRGKTRFSRREAACDPRALRARAESVQRSLSPASGDPANVDPGPRGFLSPSTAAPALRGFALRRHGSRPPVSPGHPPSHCHARANAARPADPLIEPATRSPGRFLQRSFRVSRASKRRAPDPIWRRQTVMRRASAHQERYRRAKEST